MSLGRYKKAIASAAAGVIVVVGALYTNAPPEGIDAQTAALSGAISALITGLSAFMPRNAPPEV